MTRREAAGRGLATAALWAAVLLSLLGAVYTTRHVQGVFTLADVLFDPTAFSSSPVYVVLASLLGAGLVGAGFGLLARRLTAPAFARAVLLSLASLPALYVVLAVALTIIWVPQAAQEDLVSVLLVPVGSFLYAAYGMVVAVPVAVPPAILAALMLEGWTRPEAAGQGGLARPRVRRWATQGIVAVTVALITFAAFRWPKS
jgi:hypothetical protein